jgi:hypothetical protein
MRSRSAGGIPGAVILNPQERIHVVAASRQLDRRATRGVGGGVVKQVAEDAADRQRVDPHQQRPSNLDGNRMVRVSQPRGLACLLGERSGVDQRPPCQAALPALNVASGQELVEEPPELLALPMGDVQQLLLLEH